MNKKDGILLGVSGGCDSITMLDLFLKIKDEMNISLGIAHLNHGLRGKKADHDEKYVADLAEKNDLAFYNKKVDVKALAKEQALSLEDAARRARYDFFKTICTKQKLNKIALAHTQDDQTETILLNISRGTGLSGLTGMPQRRKLTDSIEIVRPLLDFTKADLQKYCKANKLTWREDHTNNDLDLSRNRIRKEIIPKLKKLNPNLNSTFQKMSEVVAKEDEYLEKKAEEIFPSLVQKQVNNGIRLDTGSLLKHPLSLQRRVVRKALEQVQGHLTDVYLPYIENFLNNCLTTIKLDSKGKLHVSKERL
ncbi:tRNA lysidine(34) synthetase TilS [Candidatus Margulisiibacteriota bacterium]